MRHLYSLIFIFFYFIGFSQEIKWTTVTKNEYNPEQLISRGIVTLDNGDKTPEADLYIDFDSETIFYRNTQNNAIFSIFKEDFSSISLNEYKNGETVRDGAFYGEVGEEIAASLRKKLYENADLNFITITSVKKEGFFTRNQPKFEVNNGELDVSNKSSVSAKLIGINPRRVEYLDEDGDLWDRGNYGTMLGGGGISTNSDDKEKRKEARKSARILNINFGNKFFLNTRELYDFFYDEYEKNFYESLEEFKNDYIGMNLKDLLIEWGPNTDQFVIDDNLVEYIWIFERKVTESESSTTGTMNSIKKALTKCNTQATATGSIKAA